MKIVCDDRIPFIRGVFEPWAEVVYLPGTATGPEQVRDADALVTRTRTRCDAALLEGSRVRVIATATIGFDHIDTAWCDARGIVWKNAPGCNAASVEQYAASVFAVLLRRRRLDPRGLTLGVVGVGNVGSRVARIGSLLGMKVLQCDPPRARREGSRGFVGLDELLDGSDIVSLHVPLSTQGEDATWHLIDAARLGRMRPGQLLLNTSRGPVVDNSALRDALKAHAIGGAVLDVWEGEPAIDRELLGLLDIATPHIAGYGADGKARGTAAAVHAVAAVLGLPLENWKPESLPAPPQTSVFRLDGAGRQPWDLLCDAVLHSYDVREDDSRLRGDPGLFERLRGDYPVRREFPAFTAVLSGAGPEAAGLLKEAGFNVTEAH